MTLTLIVPAIMAASTGIAAVIMTRRTDAALAGHTATVGHATHHEHHHHYLFTHRPILTPRMDVADRCFLAILSLSAAWVSSGYTPDQLPFAYVFTAAHLFVGLTMLASIRWQRLLITAIAVAFGTFVGRAAGIATSLVFGGSPFPDDVVFLAVLQWTTLAWVLRPGRFAPVVTDSAEGRSQRVR